MSAVIPDPRWAALRARIEQSEFGPATFICPACGETCQDRHRDSHAKSHIPHRRFEGIEKPEPTSRPDADAPDDPTRLSLHERAVQSQRLLDVIEERDAVKRRLESRYWPSAEYRKLRRKLRELTKTAQALRSQKLNSLPGKWAGRYFKAYARYRREIGYISPSVFEAAWIDPLSVLDLPPADPFQFSISLLTGEQSRGTIESLAPSGDDLASGGEPTSSLRKDGVLEDSAKAPVTCVPKEVWNRVIGLTGAGKKSMWGYQPSNGRYEKARRAIVKNHVPNPTGWLDFQDVEQEMILHLASASRPYGDKPGKHRIEQYTGSPTLRALRKGNRRAQIMSFVRPVTERKVRDLVERDVLHQPKTELLVTEGDDGAIPNDAGVVYDLDGRIDATARLKVTLGRTGGKEWLSNAWGYGDLFDPKERQRLSRFRHSLSRADHQQLQNDFAVWLLCDGTPARLQPS